MGRRYDAQANFYNPEPLSAGQAQQLGHPEWEGLKLDARDAERLVGGAARNQTTLQTHFGGQQRNLSAEDAAAISTPSLEGASMSNDEYQRLLQGAQHNQQWDTNNQRTTGQSDINNRRNNSTRITTTGNAGRYQRRRIAIEPIPEAMEHRSRSRLECAIASRARSRPLSTKRGHLSTVANRRWTITWTTGNRRKTTMKAGSKRRPASRFSTWTFAATWMVRASGLGTGRSRQQISRKPSQAGNQALLPRKEIMLRLAIRSRLAAELAKSPDSMREPEKPKCNGTAANDHSVS